METNFIISIIFIVVIGIIIILGITIHDIRTIRSSRDRRNSKRQSQPFVTVVVEENVSDACLESIRHSDYQNYEIVFSGEHTHSKFILSLRRDAQIAPSAIRQSVTALITFPHWDYVEIKPVIPNPRTIAELFRLYHTVALAPFISLRTALMIPPNIRQPWPIVQRANIPPRRVRSSVYNFMRWLMLVMNAVLISYISFVAFVTLQPLYLLTYICALMIWVIVCLIEYPHFSYQQRISYILLSPVSFWYFFLYAFYAPLVPICRAVSNRIATLFWRAHHQTIA